MSETFEDYRSFNSLETARVVLLDTLDQLQIPYTIYKDNNRQDVILGKGLSFDEVWVKLMPADVARVDRLLLQDSEQRNETVPDNYYLRELSDEELLDILKKPDAWGADDYLVAVKLLREHGIAVNVNVMAQWKRERSKELKTLEKKEQSGTSKLEKVVVLIICLVLVYVIVSYVHLF